MVAYTKLNDEIMTCINNDLDPKLAAAQGVLKRIDERDFPTYVNEVASAAQVNEMTGKFDRDR
jgi:hypothetical protein